MGLRFMCAAEEPRPIFIDKDWVGLLTKIGLVNRNQPFTMVLCWSWIHIPLKLKQGIYINDRENIIVFYSIL